MLDQIKSMDLSFKFVFGPRPKYDKLTRMTIRQFNKWLKSLDCDPDTANLKYHQFMVSSHTSELLLYIVHLRHTYYKN